jgi:hypothetical protein
LEQKIVSAKHGGTPLEFKPKLEVLLKLEAVGL